MMYIPSVYSLFILFSVSLALHSTSVLSPEPDVGVSVMRHMWITSVQTFNLLKSSAINQQFLDDTSKQVIETYRNFVHNDVLRRHYTENFDLHEDASPSDVFYFFQRDLNSNNECTLLIEQYQTISLLIKKAVNKFLRENYVDVAVNMDSIFIWASIQGNGTSHQSHHHLGSSVSGVLYLKVPLGSGSIVFEDPRGTLPPFGRTLRVQPEEGDLIIFPSWLSHRVSPSVTPAPRISLSFNVDGSWELTSDVNHGYFVD